MKRLAGLTLLLATLAAYACGGGTPKNRPNFLLIITDDQRYDSMGQFMPETQARIFDKGIAFANGFVTTSLCCPSRASIFTGMYAHNTGVHNNPDPLNKTTFVKGLKDAGYYTGLVGKYLNSWDFNKPRPEFDDWVSDPPGSNEYYNFHLNVNGQQKTSPYYVTEVLRTYALQFIQQAAKQPDPFLLIFAPNAPHEPAIPKIGDEKLYANLPLYRPPGYNEADVSSKPRWLQNTPLLTPAQQQQLDKLRLRQLQSLKDVDRAIAALLDALQQTGKLDNTVVMFISDNGYFWGEHRLQGKVYAYEPSIRVPFAVLYPKLAPVPRVDQRLVANIDIAPTIYELAGLSAPSGVDGRSLVPLLRGTNNWRDDLLFEGWPGEGHFAAVRTAHYKYIETDGDLPELYDLDKDPNELVNVVNDPAYKGILATMRQRLAAVLKASHYQPPKANRTPVGASPAPTE